MSLLTIPSRAAQWFNEGENSQTKKQQQLYPLHQQLHNRHHQQHQRQALHYNFSHNNKLFPGDFSQHLQALYRGQQQQLQQQQQLHPQQQLQPLQQLQPQQQLLLRPRRRVRQRVDAGEPRNSYSSIPGFSLRHSISRKTSVSHKFSEILFLFFLRKFSR